MRNLLDILLENVAVADLEWAVDMDMSCRVFDFGG